MVLTQVDICVHWPGLCGLACTAEVDPRTSFLHNSNIMSFSKASYLFTRYFHSNTGHGIAHHVHHTSVLLFILNFFLNFCWFYILFLLFHFNSFLRVKLVLVQQSEAVILYKDTVPFKSLSFSFGAIASSCLM